MATTTVRGEVSIAAPPTEVFPWLVEPERLLRWQPGVEAVEYAAEPAAGAAFVVRMDRHELTGRIAEFDPPGRLVLETMGRSRTTYSLTALTGTGTRLEQVTVTAAAGPVGIWERLTRRAVQRVTQQALEALRAQVET